MIVKEEQRHVLSGVDIERIDDIAGFQSLEEEWTRLVEETENATVFQTYEWLFTWWRVFGAAKELYLLVVRESGRVIGIAPLMIDMKGPFRIVEFLGNGLSDYLDFIIPTAHEQRAIAAIVEQLYRDKAQWDVVSLQGFDRATTSVSRINEWIQRDPDRKSTRLNSSHSRASRMPSSA